MPKTPVSLPGPVGCAAVAAGLLSALMVTGKSTRDALFCGYFATTELPKAMLAGAGLSAAFALATAPSFRRRGPATVLPILLAINAVAFLVEHAALPAAPRTVALILYLHISAVMGVVLSGFWSVVNESFDPHTLRLSISRIGLGGTLGGFIGGLSAERIAAWAGARHTLLELFLLSALAALSVRALDTGEMPSLAEPAPARSEAPHASPYLFELAVFVALTALCSSVVDFAFKARAMEQFASPEQLMQFFALFYTGVSLLGFLLQATLTPHLLDRSGLGVGLGGLPAALAITGVVALVAPGLPAAGLLRAADGALVGSLYRSAYEPLYTPLPAERKRAAKSLIDVLVNRAGDALGGFLAWALVLIFPVSAAAGANATVILAALATLWVAMRLRRGYVAELRESLRSGAVVVDEAGVRDQTTRLTLSRTLSELNRERLLAEIERQRALGVTPPRADARQTSDRGPPTPRSDPGGAFVRDPDAGETATEPSAAGLAASAAERGPPAEAANASAARSVPELTADLLSRDPARLRSALTSVDPSLTAFVIPLIARDDVGAQAMNALRSFGERVIGQLADALLDAEHTPAVVRRRLVRVIASNPSRWAAAALAAALEDPDFDVRRQVAAGLEDMARADVHVPLSRAHTLEIAARELSLDAGTTIHERVEHCLRLLGLAIDHEAFRLARLALGSDDPKLRGTALEYLDNVLPSGIRGALFTLIAAEGGAKSSRQEHELLDELRRTLV